MNKYKFLKKEHVHTFVGAPLCGTTSVVGVISKNLTWWAAEVAAVTCLESGEKIPTIREEYQQACIGDKKRGIDALQKKYPIFKKARFAHYEEKNNKAEKGTDMHAELEKWVNLMISNQGGKPIEMKGYEHPAVEKFAKWAIENVERFIVSEGYTYSEKYWLGGIIDCMAILKDGRTAIIDFKSSREAFISQFIQVALYDIQVSESGLFDEEGNRLRDAIKVDTYFIFPFGAVDVKPAERKDTEELKKGALGAVELYKLINQE